MKYFGHYIFRVGHIFKSIMLYKSPFACIAFVELLCNIFIVSLTSFHNIFASTIYAVHFPIPRMGNKKMFIYLTKFQEYPIKLVIFSIVILFLAVTIKPTLFNYPNPNEIHCNAFGDNQSNNNSKESSFLEDTAKYLLKTGDIFLGVAIGVFTSFLGFLANSWYSKRQNEKKHSNTSSKLDGSLNCSTNVSSR